MVTTMGRISLPESTAPGPTKPAVRALVLWKLDLEPDDHVVDVGAGTGAVTLEAAQVADRVTAIERDPDRVAAIRTNREASTVEGTVSVTQAVAPEGLPDAADAVFVGGTRNLDGVLDWIEQVAPRTVVLNAARLETAVRAITEFRARDFDPEIRRIAIGTGQELVGETAIEPQRPVYMIAGTPGGGA
ncbi:precorrin-6Y C5,15-methyltransferase (decarboxylating) subunit CbiT [Halodesulfurarchaeum formicicum]|uniref:Precorrin-6Y C5,15-methyltransferase (Decarboxylating) subunit CbiT n=2 Tax=Halodesulfurarchaeum formicicum TaxID=1873524 RepID=A0A1D8S6N0_9EURY|nr:precorrin-6Y C5,15-methyltransferase (decarboxylating) subunit CbiT [Halodesulfurarchaeum formicicum]